MTNLWSNIRRRLVDAPINCAEHQGYTPSAVACSQVYTSHPTTVDDEGNIPGVRPATLLLSLRVSLSAHGGSRS
jgi:hypothetical protein